MGWTGPRRRGDTRPERAQTSARVSTVEKPWNAWNCRRCWMVQTELTGEQRQTATWSEIDWTATEAVVKRLQGRIYLSLSRLNHWLPRGQADPEVMQGTADFHHAITNALLPQAALTTRQRLTLLLTCSIRSRREWVGCLLRR